MPIEGLKSQELALSLDVVEVAQMAAKLNHAFS